MTKATAQTLIDRIGAKLTEQNQRLVVSRNRPSEEGLGEYYIVDILRNDVLYVGVDLEFWAERLGVLGPDEKLDET